MRGAGSGAGSDVDDVLHLSASATVPSSPPPSSSSAPAQPPPPPPRPSRRSTHGLRPRVAVLLGVGAKWYIPLLVCRALSTLPALWWGLRCAFTFLGELLLSEGTGLLGEGKWSVEKRFRVTEVALGIIWVCYSVIIFPKLCFVETGWSNVLRRGSGRRGGCVLWTMDGIADRFEQMVNSARLQHTYRISSQTV